MLSAAWALLIGMPDLNGSMSSGLRILGSDDSKSLLWNDVPSDFGGDGEGKFWISVIMILYKLIFWLDGQNLQCIKIKLINIYKKIKSKIVQTKTGRIFVSKSYKDFSNLDRITLFI